MQQARRSRGRGARLIPVVPGSRPGSRSSRTACPGRGFPMATADQIAFIEVAARKSPLLRKFMPCMSVRADSWSRWGDEPINRVCVAGDGPGRAEPADAGQRRELGSGEGQFLLGQVFRLRGVVGGRGDTPSGGRDRRCERAGRLCSIGRSRGHRMSSRRWYAGRCLHPIDARSPSRRTGTGPSGLRTAQAEGHNRKSAPIFRR
jgi:hypothetical protein